MEQIAKDEGRKRATVDEALREYIDRRKRRQALTGFGRVDFDPAWDHKAERLR